MIVSRLPVGATRQTSGNPAPRSSLPDEEAREVVKAITKCERSMSSWGLEVSDFLSPPGMACLFLALP
jgi:hypothetical protein